MILTSIAASPDDLRDIPFVPTGAPLPASVDLSQFVAQIEDQGAQGSCTANATTSAVELIALVNNINEDLSRQFNYYLARKDEGRLGQDGVMTLRSALHAGYKYGFCLESEWDHLIELAEKEPPASCFESALARRITRYERVSLNWWEKPIDHIKAALAEGLPVIIAMTVNDQFFNIKGPIDQQKYEVTDSNGKRLPTVGAHAVVVTGYDDSISRLKYPNSYTENWGDKGFGSLEYRHIGEIFEAWIVRGYRDIYIAPPEVVKPEPVPEPTPEPAPVPAPEPVPEPAPVDPAPAPQPEPTPIPEKKSSNPGVLIAVLAVIALIVFFSQT